MIPDSFLVRNMIYAIAVLQTAVAPMAFVYYVYYIATEQPLFTTQYSSVDILLHYWLGCELIFYVFFQITRNRMQTRGTPVYPGAKERRSLYQNCLSNVDNVEEWLTGWFMKANDPGRHPTLDELCRENVAEWIAWAFFAQPLESVLEDEEATQELYWMIDDFSRAFNIQFRPGYDEDIIALRITLDPVQAYHRPFAFYLFIFIMTYLIGLVLQAWGLRRYGPDTPSLFSLWWNDFSSSRNQERVAYWFRDGDRTKKPIVFIHGIGPGFLPYMKFIYNLATLNAPMFCIELPYVAMRCVEDVPTMQETLQDMERMLRRHGFYEAVFVGHSLGTAVTSWVIKHLPKAVAGVVLLDPICFMLHYKDICVNFVYRIPKTASESIVKFFASSELYISYYISRHFHWFQMSLYVTASQSAGIQTSSATPIPKTTKVFLSERDNIVNSSRVLSYLHKHGVDCVMMPKLDHGWFLFKSAWQQQILDTVSEYITS